MRKILSSENKGMPNYFHKKNMCVSYQPHIMDKHDIILRRKDSNS